MYLEIIKPILDRLAAFLLLILLAPVLLLLALLVRITIGKPALFKQLRIGPNNAKFWIYKFRTLLGDGEAGALPEEELQTNIFGRFLRKTSLDELPQLINILKGEMSFVGPRPIVESDYFSCKIPGHEMRHSIKPGLTGWAQVNGRNKITWEQKFTYDLWYIEHVSFWLDLKIIVLTIVREIC